MSDILLTLVAFLFAISVLIAVHEFGHYWVARRLGIKVLRFSIGFGKPLWRWVSRDEDHVEYVIAALPLGGYVKMLDEREGEVAPEELNRAFNRQPVAKRFAVVLAGPLFNLIFAIATFWLMFMHGVPGVKPELGAAPVESVAAAAGIHQGEVVLTVDGARVRTWNEVMEKVLPKALLREQVTLVTEAGGVKQPRILNFSAVHGDEKMDQLLDIIGLVPFYEHGPTRLVQVLPGSVAEAAGLQAEDIITAVNGEPTPDASDMIAIVSKHPDESIVVTYQRDGVSHDVSLKPRAADVDGKVVGRIDVAVTNLSAEIPERLMVEVKYGPIESLYHGAAYLWDNVAVTFKMIGGMLSGQVSTDQVSGVITIAKSAKNAAMHGLSAFLHFLGIVSLSLGVLNLLPIPVLDGGHLAFYLAEAIKGSPVSERTEMVAQRVGIALILALMTLAIYNDLARSVG